MAGAEVYAYVAGNPTTFMDPLGLCPPNDSNPPDLLTPNDELVSEAVIAALSVINPTQDVGKNVVPLTANFAQVDPSAIDTGEFYDAFTTHGTAFEASIPGYSSYSLKLYDDPSLGFVMAVVYPTFSVQHVLNFIPYVLGKPVNADIAWEFLMTMTAGTPHPW